MTTIKEILADFDKKFNSIDTAIVTITSHNGFSEQKNTAKEVKDFISSSRSHLIDEIIKMAKEMKEEADQYEPPKNCGRSICTSCPEMKGRANGYRRAVEDMITNLSTLIEKK